MYVWFVCELLCDGVCVVFLLCGFVFVSVILKKVVGCLFVICCVMLYDLALLCCLCVCVLFLFKSCVCCLRMLACCCIVCGVFVMCCVFLSDVI